jgi:hypothetical protein
MTEIHLYILYNLQNFGKFLKIVFYARVEDNKIETVTPPKLKHYIIIFQRWTNLKVKLCLIFQKFGLLTLFLSYKLKAVSCIDCYY